MLPPLLTLLLLITLSLPPTVPSSKVSPFTHQKNTSSNRDREIAARFAPILYQALGDAPRGDYITNFDFDGDWRGDNNWVNSEKKEFALKAFVYFAVAETATHFCIQYAIFHPRDYKGGERSGKILSELIREGIKRGAKYDPTGLADEASLAHENDLEGALVIVRKNGNDLVEAEVAYVETLHHNRFARYVAGDPQKDFASIKVEKQRPLLYVEPKGHGIEAYAGDQKQIAKKEFLRYVFGGSAEEPSQTNSVCRDLEATPCATSVSFDLLPLATLWEKAQGKPNETYGTSCDYGQVAISVRLNDQVTDKKIRIGKVGCAFLGTVGGLNMARPPWGWFDREERDRPLGGWFFDPAATIKRDFRLDDSFSITYIRLPFWVK